MEGHKQGAVNLTTLRVFRLWACHRRLSKIGTGRLIREAESTIELLLSMVSLSKMKM